MALRIVLACIESHANRYKRHIVPIISLSIDFYVRVFVRVYTSANAVKDSATKLAYVYQVRGSRLYPCVLLVRLVLSSSWHCTNGFIACCCAS